MSNSTGGSGYPGGSCFPSDYDIEINNLIVEARRFVAVSHLFWCIWSFLLAEESPIEFDYLSYGLDRLALYYESKSLLLEYLH
ncbi:unnamed protein product [Gongylonema pulchrum]|uniref:Casein kinase II subunit beta n=1 Tax=Gongylonema pulchrum TaxID=637853 RepID=A0A183D8S5_9BILA|nr:unnamed protein product [Gongylonema pulchrum]